MPRRRFGRLILLAAVAVSTLFLLFSPSSSSTRQIASSAVEAVIPAEAVRDRLSSLPGFELPKFGVPDGLKFTWHRSVHKPPEQSNSTLGDSKWYSDWKWLNPFSSSVTLDEERAVLPPLPERPPVYTYYDTTVKRDSEQAESDRQLLLVWRRAWWAKGFKPIVLTDAEAASHRSYVTLKRQGVPADLEHEFMAWLAWAHMGTGLLANWRCVPMGPYDDKTLVYLRQGKFEQLARFDGLENGLFAGEKSQIEDALKASLGNAELGTRKSVIEAVGEDKFLVDMNPSGLAYYDNRTIESKYGALATALKDKPANGRRALNALIDAHLHTTWQNSFPAGINVLKPLPKHSTALVQPAIDLANLLAECPSTILQASCPPNRPRCVPCSAARMLLSQSQDFHNKSGTFTISIVPHPYTMITLNKGSASPDVVTVRHIRRDTERDQWVSAVTRRVLGNGRGGPSRVVMLKDMVASSWGSSRSLWFTTEQLPAEVNRPPPPEKAPTNDVRPAREIIQPFPEEWVADLSWHFGFTIPLTSEWHGEAPPPVPGAERWGEKEQQHPGQGSGQPTDSGPKSAVPKPPTGEELAKEVELLRDVREKMNDPTVREQPPANSKKPPNPLGRMLRVAEAWNMADTEAWKFVRAYRARADVERDLFEEEERKYHWTDGPAASGAAGGKGATGAAGGRGATGAAGGRAATGAAAAGAGRGSATAEKGGWWRKAAPPAQ